MAYLLDRSRLKLLLATLKIASKLHLVSLLEQSPNLVPGTRFHSLSRSMETNPKPWLQVVFCYVPALKKDIM